jgi:hypothetical protein
MNLKELEKEIKYLISVGCGEYPVQDEYDLPVTGLFCNPMGENIIWFETEEPK